jgi:hypothetical protein
MSGTQWLLPGDSEPVEMDEVVGRRAFVVAETAQGDEHGQGRVIAWTDRPTFIIERADGTRFSWICDMCRPASTKELLALLNRFVDQAAGEPR